MADLPQGTTTLDTSSASIPRGATSVDEGSDGLRAFAGSALEGIPIIGQKLLEFGEFLRSHAKGRPIEEVRAETQKMFAEHPNLRTTGNIVGSILGTAAIPGAAFSTAPLAIGTGAVLSGADVAARGGDAGDIALGAGLGAGGAAAGVGLAKVGRGIVSAIRVPRGKLAGVIRGASDDLREQAHSFYQQADAVGVKLTGSTFDGMIDRITKAATPKGDLADDVLRANTPKAAAAIKWLKSLRGREPTLSEIDQIRQFLGDVAGASDAGERRLGSLMKDALDNSLDDLTNANFVKAELKEGISALDAARGLWRRGRIVETIADATERAELANQPIGQAIQREVRTLLRRTKFTRSLNPAEKTMLKKIARDDIDSVLGTVGQLRTLAGAGTFGGGAGALTFGLSGDLGSASLVGGGLGLATQLGSSGARGLRSVFARQRLLDATEAMRAGTEIPAHLLPRLPERIGGAVGVGTGIGIGQQVFPGDVAHSAPDGAVQVPTQ